ncbi:MAG TPA: hypothetical protein V6D22_13620 [Candidatus Obscuribacterales bacterium]
MTAMRLTEQEIEIHRRLVTDYEFFARHIQKIEPKDLTELDGDVLAQYDALHGEDSIAGMIPLVPHPGQKRLLGFRTAMLAELGLVRAALVKPRQVGWSTIIQGLANWLAGKTPGMKIHIVSHNAESTRKFLRRARKMALAAPPTVTPAKQVENSKELIFANGASYSIATAGSPDSVRSDSFHFGHFSEEAFWPDPIASTGAIIPALSDGVGSEGYRESTAQGRGTPWHLFIQECLAGENRWKVFFDPWFAHPKYRLQPPEGWRPDEEALEAQRLYNLDMAQLYWRAMKIKDLRALWMFKQEFPATIDEAFQSSASTLYNPDAVTQARKNGRLGIIAPDAHAPIIIGCDPARTGDRTALAIRQGSVLHEVRRWPKMDDMQLVGIIANLLTNPYKGQHIKKCFIDYAIGQGVVSRLRELGFFMQVQAVHFAEAPTDPRFLNKRAEMFFSIRDWLGDSGLLVSIPDDEALAADLLAIPDFLQSIGSEKIKLASKDEIKKEYGRSPDLADAVALTFAYPVMGERIAELQQFARHNLTHVPGSEIAKLMSDFEAR